MPLRHSVLRGGGAGPGQPKRRTRNVPPLEEEPREPRDSKNRATIASNMSLPVEKSSSKQRGTTFAQVSSEQSKNGSKTRATVGTSLSGRQERSEESEDERFRSKDSSMSSGSARQEKFKKSIGRLASRTTMMLGHGEDFGETHRDYLDFLYRKADQLLMWEQLDAATARLEVIQEVQEVRKPTVKFTSRNSISDSWFWGCLVIWNIRPSMGILFVYLWFYPRVLEQIQGFEATSRRWWTSEAFF